MISIFVYTLIYKHPYLHLKYTKVNGDILCPGAPWLPKPRRDAVPLPASQRHQLRRAREIRNRRGWRGPGVRRGVRVHLGGAPRGEMVRNGEEW